MRKRLLSIILLLTVISSLLTVMPASAADYVVNSENYKLLAGIGLIIPIEDKELSLVDTVSRGELARVIANVLYRGDVPTSDEEVFSDVPAGSEEANAIAEVYRSRIMVGNGDGTFGPDMAVTYTEGIKSIVTLMGYQKLAESYGGYPNGYMAVASQIGLLKGVGDAANDLLSYEQFLKIMVNASEAPVMSILFDSINENKIEYSADEDKDFINQYFDIYYDKGIITANSKTSLYGEGCAKDTVKINNEEYNVGKTNAADFIGHSVKYYYHYDRKLKENVLDYVGKESKSKELEIVSNLLERAEMQNSSRKVRLYYYQNDDKDKELKLDMGEDVSVIINSCASNTFTVDDFIPKLGSIRVIDNNGDGIYDVAIIENCDVIIADNIAIYYGYITDKFRKNSDGTQYKTEIDFDDTSSYKITMNGKELQPGDIRPYDVLSIFKSKTSVGDYTKLIVTRESVTASAQTVNSDEAVINDKIYKYNSFFKDYIETSGKTIPINKKCTFYLDHNGMIAGMKEEKNDDIYGYVRKAWISDDEFESVEMRVYDMIEDEWNTFKCSKKVKIDSEAVNNDDILQLQGQPIKYRLNSNGEITKIILPKKYGGVKYLMKNDYLDAIGEGNGSGTHYFFNSDTACLKLPADAKDLSNEKAYGNSFDRGHQSSAEVQLYDMDGFVIGLCVYEEHYSEPSVSAGNEGVIVTYKGIGINADDVVVGKLEGLAEGYETISGIVSENCTSGETFKKIKVGDLIRLEKNEKGEIAAVEIDVPAEKALKSDGRFGSLHTKLCYYYGTVDSVDIDNNIFSIAVDDSIMSMRIPDTIIINNGKEKNAFEKGYAGDLKVGKRVIYRALDCFGKLIEILDY